MKHLVERLRLPLGVADYWLSADDRNDRILYDSDHCNTSELASATTECLLHNAN